MRSRHCDYLHSAGDMLEGQHSNLISPVHRVSKQPGLGMNLGLTDALMSGRREVLPWESYVIDCGWRERGRTGG